MAVLVHPGLGIWRLEKSNTLKYNKEIGFVSSILTFGVGVIRHRVRRLLLRVAWGISTANRLLAPLPPGGASR
jgi:hypothetical protein